MQRCWKRARAIVILTGLGSVVACATSPRVGTAGSQGASVRDTATPSAPNVNSPSTAFTLPAPAGLVTDLAGVVPDSAEQAIEEALRKVRAVTEGEIAVVTMATLPGVTPRQMAQRIGHEWGVGARTGRARHAGAVVLVIPQESSSDGRGHCRIELGTGASAFIADSVAATMCASAIPFFRVRDYAKGLETIVAELARRYLVAQTSVKSPVE